MKDLSDVHGKLGRDGLLKVVNNASQVSGLPPVDDASDFMQELPELPAEIVCGVLHRGCKGVLGGGSKSFKTWSLMDLALSVATGSPWWGYETLQGPVLYLNMEVPRAFFATRLHSIATARGLEIPTGTLHVWNLRGHANVGEIVQRATEQARSHPYALIVVDPFYKLAAGSDENAAGEMALVLAQIDRLAEQTGAAVMYGHHFSKGNQSQKETIDRMSGSGVFARDADAILTLTAHEESYAYTLESVLRNHPPTDPCVLRWEFPLMVRDSELNPARLKAPKTGREQKHRAQDIMDVLRQVEPASSVEWQRACKEEKGISSGCFYSLKREVESQVRKDDAGKWESVP
jgi:hypothetical protein